MIKVLLVLCLLESALGRPGRSLRISTEEFEDIMPEDLAARTKREDEGLTEEPGVDFTTRIIPINRDLESKLETAVRDSIDAIVPELLSEDDLEDVEIAIVNEIEGPDVSASPVLVFPENLDPYDIKELKKKKFVYHRYYGFIPLTVLQDLERETNQNETFFYHPKFRFIPAVDLNKNEMTFVRHPFHGLVPKELVQDDNSTSDMEFLYHSYYGYVPVSIVDDLNIDKLKERQFVYTRMTGFIPVASNKTSDEVDAGTKEVLVDDRDKYYFHPFYGFVSIDESIYCGNDTSSNCIRYIYDPEFGFVHAMKDEESSGKSDVYYDPYFGYMPSQAAEEPRTMRKVKFYYDRIFGFVPLRKQTKQKTEDQPIQEFYYDSSRGFVPIVKMTEIDSMQEFYFDPLFGYLPIRTEKVGNETKVVPEERQEFYYLPRFGYVPVDKKSENETSDDRQEFYYHPLLGFMALTDEENKSGDRSASLKELSNIKSEFSRSQPSKYQPYYHDPKYYENVNDKLKSLGKEVSNTVEEITGIKA